MNWFSRRTPLTRARWVVIDCETSGLDPRRDRLLSVGALRVQGGAHGERILLGESFSSGVRASEASARQNILVHGIGADRQLAAPPLEEVLPQLARFIDGQVPVAFHAWFDREVLGRAMAPLGLKLPSRWLDLEPLGRALFPQRNLRTLDEWLAACDIQPAGRHEAMLDALAAAELLLVLLSRARRDGLRTVEELLAAAGKIPL